MSPLIRTNTIKVKNLNEHIEKLIVLYCLKSISNKELEELKSWIKQDIENKKLFNSYLLTYQKHRAISFIENINTENSWNKIQERTVKSRKISFKITLRYAAAILLPFAIALATWYISMDGFNFPTEMAIQPIPPGNQGAELILSNGQIVPIESDTTYEIKENDGSNILKTATSLSYKNIQGSSLKSKVKLFNTLRTKHGKESFVELSDGTKVWLNSMSSLKYPVSFNSKNRIVVLSGEAYFEVAKDAERPFFVKIKDYTVKVLGTSFNISSYDNDEVIRTTLSEGQVEINSIKGLDKDTFILEPNQQFSFSKIGLKAEVRNVNASQYSSWRYGRFSFDEDTLEDIFRILERWYDIDVFYDEHSVKYELFTGELPRFEDMNKILDKMEYVSEVKFRVENNIILVMKE